MSSNPFERHDEHCWEALSRLQAKWSKADPKPIGFVGSYTFGDNYTKTMECTPTLKRPYPVYGKPHKMTTLEWQQDPRTVELFELICAQDALLKAGVK